LTLWNVTNAMVVGNIINSCGAFGIQEIDACDFNTYIGNQLFSNTAGPIFLVGGTNTEAIRNVAEAGVDVQDTGGFRQTIDGWALTPSAQSQSDQEMPRADGRFRALRSGSLTGLIITSSADCTAGSITVEVFRNTGLAGATGSSILTAILDTTPGNTSRSLVIQAKGVDTFDPGDELYIRYTTDAIFRSGGGPVTLIAREGQVIPGGNGKFPDLQAAVFALNDRGDVAFTTFLDQASMPNSTGVFYYSDQTGLVTIARTGDQLLGSTITSVSVVGASNLGKGAMQNGLNNSGQIAYSFKLADSRTDIALATVIPQPTAVALIALAAVLLANLPSARSHV
jgi:hypothetical protein